MTNKRQLRRVIEKLTEESFEEGRMIESKITRAIKSLKLLPKADAIFALSEYLKGLKRRERMHTMYLETSIPLSPSQINKAKKIISKRVKITKVQVNVNPEILGGFKLKVGDEVWDESVLGKINEVKEIITHGRPN